MSKKKAKKKVTKAAALGRARKMVKRLEAPDRESKFLKVLEKVKPAKGKKKLEKDFADTLLAEAFFLLAGTARSGRGSKVADGIIDGVVGKWDLIPKGVSYQQSQFLRNALANVSEKKRLQTLAALAGENPDETVLFNLACSYAAVGDKKRMLKFIKACTTKGISPKQIVADRDFTEYLKDPEFVKATEVQRIKIKWAPAPHAKGIKKAIAELVKAIEPLNLQYKLYNPMKKADILSFEKKLGQDLPNDYRAFLLQHDGCKFHGYEMLGIRDFEQRTRLFKRARDYLDDMSGYGDTEILDCIPLANLDQPNNWLLYDPIGNKRGEGPGHLVMLTADVMPIEGLLERFEYWLEYFQDW